MRPYMWLFVVMALLCGAPAQAGELLARDWPAGSVDTLQLDSLPGPLSIERSTDGGTHLRVTGEAPGKEPVTATLSGSSLILGAGPDAGSSATVVTEGGGSVTNVIIGGGTSKVTVGGKTYESSGEPLDIEIQLTLPPGLELEGALTDVLESSVSFSSVRLKLAGVAHAKMREVGGAVFEVKVSGSGALDAEDLEGSQARLKLAGASEASLAGSFASLEIKASGACKVLTRGRVAGDLKVDLSGASEARHEGAVGGSVQRELSGASDFVHQQ